MSMSDAIMAVRELLTLGVPAVLGPAPTNIVGSSVTDAYSDGFVDQTKLVFYMIITLGGAPRVVYVHPAVGKVLRAVIM